MNILVGIIFILSCSNIITGAIAFMATRACFACGKERTALQNRVVNLLEKLDLANDDRSRESKAREERNINAIVRVGEIMEDFRKYYERTPLTRRESVQQEEGVK